MPTFEEARRIILERVTRLEAERVGLLDSLGRALITDVIAPWALPQFDNSAMDGFAVRAADCADGSCLPVTGFIAAGGRATQAVEEGTAVRIMTGAAMPEGGDSVVPLEDAEETEGAMRAVKPVTLHQHVRYAGEDVRAGETVLRAGTVVRSYEINLLASFGMEQVEVVRRPRVAIVATGDELMELGSAAEAGRIVNSNSYSLAAAVTAVGAVPVMVGIARDNRESHREKLGEGLKADVLVTSAGVSVGDHDLVREVLGELGVESVFWKVQVRPGKSLAFGMKDGKPVFALPGNPVSTMLTFEEFVAPALRVMMGEREAVRPVFTAVLRSELKKKAGHAHLMRMRVEVREGKFEAWSAGKQATGFVKTLVEANAVAVLPAERERFEVGEEVQVHWLE